MRIGINAGILLHQTTGIGRYLISLLEEFAKNDQHEYFLYLPTKVNIKESVITKKMTIRSSCFKSGVGKKIWEQVTLPFWAKKDHLDVFWSPSHHLPICMPEKITRVVTIHDVVWKKYPETMSWLNYVSEALLMPIALRSANHIITVSNSTANDIVNFWPEMNKKITIIHPGVSHLSKNTGVKYETGIRRKYILTVGTLEPRKNLSRIIEAYLLLSDRLRAEYSLVIVGGEGWGSIKKYREEKYLSERIKFLGYLTDNQLRELYSEASLFVMPSLYEGFGLPLLEAMSNNVPIVTSNCSSMPEVVKDAAVLVNPLEVKSISNGVSSVLQDDELRKNLIKMGGERVNEFSWKKAAKETLNVFIKA